MLSKLVKNKEKAFALGTKNFQLLLSQYYMYSKQGVSSELQDKHIGLNVLDTTNYIYNNNIFYEYLKYSFLAKYYEKKISLIEWIVILFFVFLGILSYFIFGFGVVFIISVIVLVIGLILIFHFLFKTGESYSSYYNRTMLSFLMNVYPNLKCSIYDGRTITEEEIGLIINQIYDKKKTFNNIDFSSNISNGNISDMELIRIREKRNNDGSTSKSESKIFDGFYIKINAINNFNLFRGNIIKIRSDESLFSSITEDTVRGIYESEREISFNSEEMNKSFDGRISGYNGFASVDDVMIQVQKVLTPSFEEHLLYLRKRYNSFNMNISDNGIAVAINMERSLFQQAKHSELLDFKTSYREANERFKMIKPDISGIEDFAYYNVFPLLERLYLINYLTYLYLSYMDFDHYYSVNSGDITSFEQKMESIYTMENKEFRKLYTDKIKEIKNNTKEFAKKFEKEERVYE